MKAAVFEGLAAAQGAFGPCALAIGNFDGVHIGHQALIRHAAHFAHHKNLTLAVLTFHPHPTAIVAPHRLPPALGTLEERIRLLSGAGVERILVLPFTEEVSQMMPQEFVWQILVNALDARAIFVGENFHFGRGQSGTPETLFELGSEFGFMSYFLEPISWRGEVVSSSAIRRHVTEGSVSRAARLLGRCFSMEGFVVSGHGIGSKQTVPTLNLRPEAGLLTPRGVFITETIDLKSDRRWPSITNCGFRPTFGGDELSVETFLLAPLAGDSPRQIQVQFRRFVRVEKPFPNADALKTQILRDVGRAREYWRRVARLAKAIPSIY